MLTQGADPHCSKNNYAALEPYVSTQYPDGLASFYIEFSRLIYRGCDATACNQFVTLGLGSQGRVFYNASQPSNGESDNYGSEPGSSDEPTSFVT